MSIINLQEVLNLAARSGEVGLMSQAVRAGAKINVEARGVIPIVAAVWSNHYDAVNEAIQLGADVGANNEVLLRAAIGSKNPYIIELLLRHGASTEGFERHFTDLAYFEVTAARNQDDLSMAQRVVSIIAQASVDSLARARARELGGDLPFCDLSS